MTWSWWKAAAESAEHFRDGLMWLHLLRVLEHWSRADHRAMAAATDEAVAEQHSVADEWMVQTVPNVKL